MSNQLIAVNSKSDILTPYRQTPIGDLLEYHNLNKTFTRYDKSQILIGMCVDNRKSLWIPENFAVIIRAAGANLIYSEFQISFAISIANLKHIALIAHNHCGMVNLSSIKEQFVAGLVQNAGWKAENAENHFNQLSVFFEIGNETEFIVEEAKRLQKRYPKLTVAPLYFNIDDGMLYQIGA
ncbi:MAG: carbonic anhydrase [Bacteroidetes bacterium GWF2_42_66]|nr:MAG: carbonic anhydrase [Bacteroidetes bacterium GWA2_42_15]OFY00046.1 MAG: carbonic anhydrase [Bacteroidetes bacterium GWE2_42_39]OFY40189.1 MAG: carbonic anhydrase [Bacteroidetes bacterium GWF2_42_66]HBL74020.1 carbonic anhydrase [Prolixibacteraceae bacterium]HCR89560.1 carbonic anhydrase [Prolixibacteraceae bacterium]